MEHEHERRAAPWVWVLIVLVALILVFVVWWVVAAQDPDTVMVVPGPSQPTISPQPQPSQPTQPVVVQPQPPVNIYICTKQPAPEVYVVPKGQQRPSGAQDARQVTLPGAFNYQGRTWSASNQAVTSDTMKLKEIGVSVNGKPLYAAQEAKPPYDALYLETSSGSEVFLKYD